MANEKLVTIKEADITNNCPECFNQQMSIRFYQKHRFSKLYDRTTKEISFEVECHKCHSIIYPVNWTPDIERIFEYYRKMAIPEKASIRFTPMFYLLIVLLLVFIGAGVYLYLEGLFKF
jgi:hypothetical protein